MEFHELANIFPLIEGEDLEALVEDIWKNGIQENIIYTFEGKILDGRNRYRACAKLGIDEELELKEFTGTREESSF